ncbi:MAG: copper homeostasis membrane protein CopD [Hyphomicrobium sp.]|nr:copper homeostasis membrane protein CopD [Hyphomicrobium sp.]
MIEPETVIICLRAAMLGAGAVCFGAGSAALLLAPPQVASVLRAYLQPVLRGAAGVLAVAALVSLAVQTADASEDWSQAISPSALFMFATTTHAGRTSSARALLAVVSALCILLARGNRIALLRLGSLTAGLFLASFAFSGHAAMHDEPTRTLQEANHIAHVLSGTFWTGALVALFCAAIILLRRPSGDQVEGAELMLRRFSPAGVTAVVIVGLTGALNTWLILGRAPLDRGSIYQLLLAAKIAAVAVMLGLALANRFYFLPRATRPAALVASIAIECALGALVIALVAVFGTLEPV